MKLLLLRIDFGGREFTWVATPCLKIMLRQRDEKLEKTLPRELEGYRVVTEVGGEIRPLSTSKAL